MKKMLFFIILTVLSTMMNSCLLIDLATESDDYETCTLLITNNSDKYIVVGAETINKLNNDTTFGYIGYVEKQTVSKDIRLWHIWEDDNVSWSSFFSLYNTDSLAIIIAANNMDNLYLWHRHRNDSVILKKYSFALHDLEVNSKSLSISYP